MSSRALVSSWCLLHPCRRIMWTNCFLSSFHLPCVILEPCPLTNLPRSTDCPMHPHLCRPHQHRQVRLGFQNRSLLLAFFRFLL